MRKRGTEAATPMIREHAKESSNDYDEDGRWSEVASPLAVTVETITRRDMICKGKKMTRKEERTIHEAERQTAARWLDLLSISRAKVKSTKKRRGKTGPLPVFDEARRGGFYRQVGR